MATRDKAREAERRYRAQNLTVINERRRARRSVQGRTDYDPVKYRAYYEANHAKMTAKSRTWRAANSERAKANGHAWQQANKPRCAEYQARRRGRWRFDPAVTVFYEIAKRVTACTGIVHEVDHIVPLKGRKVSGLHIPWNLRVVPKAINRRKSNRTEF